MCLESAWKGWLKWFVADVLAVSCRHEGRRTKMLVGRSLSCCTEGNLYTHRPTHICLYVCRPVSVCISLCTVWVKKSSPPPPKTLCNIFTQVKYISVIFCQYVASLYLYILTTFGRFVLIFNKMASIFLGVPIVFNVSSFKFHQVKSRWLHRQ